MGIVFAKMSSWTALTGHTGMKIAFETRNMKSQYFGIFIMKNLEIRVIEENGYLKGYSTKQHGTHKIGF